MTPKTKKPGTNKKHVPMEIVDTACAFNANMAQVLEALRAQGYVVHRSTIEREIQRLYKIPFATYRDQKTELTRLRLVQKAVKMASEGHATMLIFCLKNLCNWKDRNEVTAPPPPDKTGPQMSTEERRARIKELEARARELGDD